MSERFFVDTPITTERATLRGTEAHHLLHVMRAQMGDEVRLFDGSGSEFNARVEQLGRSEVELRVLNREEVNCESSVELTLAVALPKGDRQRWLVEKAVELGVKRIMPLITKRGVAEASGSTLERLRRTVIEASKQCGRNRLLEISEPKDWEHTVQEMSPDRMRWLAESNGIPLKSVWPARNSATSTDRPSPQPSPGARGSRIIAAIGPEGGFTDEEMNSALVAGWTAVSLGPRILRVETAALAIAAWVAAESAGNWPASG